MAHLYTYSSMDNIIYFKRKLSKQILSMLPFYLPIFLFLDNSTTQLFHFLLDEIFLKLISLNFWSYHLPQANLLQIFIRSSIRKIYVQKQKLSLISFHLFGIMITFWGLTKTTDNSYGVLKYSKEINATKSLTRLLGKKGMHITSYWVPQ